eukprot:scaffold111843_cov32-Tisochrysis_lutea.AAC.6
MSTVNPTCLRRAPHPPYHRQPPTPNSARSASSAFPLSASSTARARATARSRTEGPPRGTTGQLRGQWRAPTALEDWRKGGCSSPPDG